MHSGPPKEPAPVREQATRTVLLLTVATMLVELVVGYSSGSMALVADGWHMSSHATAMLLAWVVHVAVRRARAHGRPTFAPARLNALGGYTSALLLTGFAAHMAVESVDRLRFPVAVRFDLAVVVAVVGLAVNLVSAKLLHDRGDDHDHDHDHDHGHGHGHGHDDPPHALDHNQRAAFVHVVADAFTSVLAIVALLGGRYAGWNFLDPVMGLVGAVFVTAWAVGLARASARTLVSD